MKRLLSFFLASVMLLAFPITASAIEFKVVSEETIWFENGSSMIITIQESNTRSSGTKSGSARYTFRDDNGKTCWIATLSGTFTYNGTSATCTSSSVNVSISDNAWYLISKSAAKSGNTATATVTMGLKVLGITVSKPTYNLTLTCDKDGNLS